MCEVQSDKASVEITSPFDGTVTEILVKEGDVAKVGEGLCLIEVEEEQHEDQTPASPDPPKPPPDRASAKPHPLDPSHSPPTLRSDVLATPSVRHFAKQKDVDLAQISSGSGKGGRIEKRDVEAFLASKSEQPPPVSEVGDQVVELGRTRFAMWKAMTKVNKTFTFPLHCTDTMMCHRVLKFPISVIPPP